MATGALRALSCSRCGAPLDVAPKTGAVTCAYCKRVHASAPVPANRSILRGRYEPKTPVRIDWGGLWWRGRIVSVVDDGSWEVSYDGWSSDWNEVVGPERLAMAGDSDCEPAPPAGAMSGASVVGAVIALLIAIAVATLAFTRR